MKKRIAFVLLMGLLCALCLCVMAEEAKAETFTSGDYKYTLLEDGTAKITEYKGKAKMLEVPAELDGHTVTGIGDMAFFFCSSLTNVTLPDSIKTIGGNPFIGCDKLLTIKVSPDHPTLAVIDGVLFEKSNKKLICYPCGKQEKTYSVPQGIREIGDYAFSGCDSLTGITLPDSITSIGSLAFSGCSSLINVTLPDSITSIGDSAFWGCSSLTSVTLPDSLASIGYSAFYNCSPSLVITVPRDSYAAQYCKDNNLNYTYPDANDWLNN